MYVYWQLTLYIYIIINEAHPTPIPSGAPPVHRMAIAQRVGLVPPPARHQQRVARAQLHVQAACRGGSEAGEALLGWGDGRDSRDDEIWKNIIW